MRHALAAVSPLLIGTCFVLYPISVAYTNDWIDPSELVPASAGLLMAFEVGSTIGPLASVPWPRRPPWA